MSTRRRARRLAIAGAAGFICATLAAGAFAQAIQSTPLPPPPGTGPSLGVAPPAQPAPQTPASPQAETPPAQTLPSQAPPAQTPPAQTPPAQTPPAQTPPAAPDTATSPPAAPAPGTTEPLTPSQTAIGGPWEPRTGFVLRGLNKITAQPSELTGKVGETVHFGTLAITVRSCVARPPNQPEGAAAFLDVTDTAQGADPATAFHGWMFSNFPALAMLQHPTYDVRVVGCKP